MTANQKPKSSKEKHNQSKRSTADGSKPPKKATPVQPSSGKISDSKKSHTSVIPLTPRKNTKHKKVFDVVPPGKAPAATNSRSVITGHKPLVADDQFIKQDRANDNESGFRAVLGAPEIPGKTLSNSSSRSIDDIGGTDQTPSLMNSHDKATSRPVTSAPLLKEEHLKDREVGQKVSGSSVSQGDFSEGLRDSLPPEPLDESVATENSPVVPGVASRSNSSVTSSAASQNYFSSSEVDSRSEAGRADDKSSARSSTLDQGRLSAPELLADLAVEQVVQSETIDELQGSGVEGALLADSSSSYASAELARASGDSLGAAVQGAAGSSIANYDSGSPLNVAHRPPQHFTGAVGAHSYSSSVPRSVDDLLADSSAPELPSLVTPKRFSAGKLSGSSASSVSGSSTASPSSSVAAPKAIVSTHHRRRHHHHKSTGVGKAFLIFLMIILVATLTLNFLLDAEIIRTELNLPHTDLIE